MYNKSKKIIIIIIITSSNAIPLANREQEVECYGSSN